MRLYAFAKKPRILSPALVKELNTLEAEYKGYADRFSSAERAGRRIQSAMGDRRYFEYQRLVDMRADQFEFSAELSVALDRARQQGGYLVRIDIPDERVAAYASIKELQDGTQSDCYLIPGDEFGKLVDGSDKDTYEFTSIEKSEPSKEIQKEAQKSNLLEKIGWLFGEGKGKR
ncbi:MAG: hypothetical protein AAB855_02235 [Patescibacteria group bacterium]